jgi:hypothetical protein
LALLLVILGLTSVIARGNGPRVTKVSSIPVQWRKNSILEDVCPNGLVLLDAMGFPKKEPNLLLLWDLERGKPAFQVTMDAWDEHSLRVSEGVLFASEGLRCVDGGKRVAGRQAMYLALIDVERPQDMTWVLPSRDLNDVSLPQLSHGVDHLISATFAVNPANGLIAAAYNKGVKPRIFLYAADLKSVTRTWELAQFVQDIGWSPDGKRLAVLYSGEIDAKGKYVGQDPNFHPLGIPEVEILDPVSGERLLRFFSGDREAKIAFSADGTRLCTISLRDQEIKNEGAVRMFSASTGSLLKKITSGRYQLHNNFAMSPDGRLIVADASTHAPNLLLNALRYGLRAPYIKMARFVILDTQTGKVLFEHHEETAGPGFGVYPMRFGFSRDGRRLLVDPNFAGCADNERVDVYSLDGLR